MLTCTAKSKAGVILSEKLTQLRVLLPHTDLSKATGRAWASRGHRWHLSGDTSDTVQE